MEQEQQVIMGAYHAHAPPLPSSNVWSCELQPLSLCLFDDLENAKHDRKRRVVLLTPGLEVGRATGLWAPPAVESTPMLLDLIQ